MPVSKIKVEFIEKEVIEQKAKALILNYQKISSDIFPVNPEAILWEYLYPKYGVGLDDENSLGIDEESGELILGQILPQKKEIRIDVGLRKQKGRYNFTLAHEIGHWVLHNHYLLDLEQNGQRRFFGEETLEFSSLNRNIFPKESHSKIPPEEWQANQFAVYLLIDSDLLKSEFAKRFGEDFHDYRIQMENGEIDKQIYSLRAYSRYIAKTSVMGLPSLANFFVVSVETMAIRLEEIGVVYESPKYSLFPL